MPNNPELYNQKDIHPLKEIYQDVKKNEIQFLGKIWEISNTMATPHQSNNPHEIPQTIRNKPHNQERGSEKSDKTGMLPIPTESQTNTIKPTERRKKRTRRIKKNPDTSRDWKQSKKTAS